MLLDAKLPINGDRNKRMSSGAIKLYSFSSGAREFVTMYLAIE